MAAPMPPPRRCSAGEAPAAAETGLSGSGVEQLLREACRQAWNEGYHASNVDACMNAEFGGRHRSANPYGESVHEAPPAPAQNTAVPETGDEQLRPPSARDRWPDTAQRTDLSA